jgi:hypothetical protein
MKPPKVSKSKIEQIIDLKEISKRTDFSKSKTLKMAIGEALVETIRERAESGKGLKFSEDGSAREVKLKSPYSKTYAESLDFAAAGKSKNKVNMTLTGDMLASIQVRDAGGDKIAIYVEGEEQVLKAFNHITGDTVPERPFFGVAAKDLRSIANDFQDEIDSIETREGLRTEAQRSRRRLSEILSEIEEDLEDG